MNKDKQITSEKLEDKIALKLNELVADFMSYNNIMTIQDYDDLMLKSEK